MVTLEDAMRGEPIRRSFVFDLLRRLPERQRFSLGEDVCQEHVVVAADGIQRLCKCDEVAGNEPGPLVKQLIEGMLAIGARLAPIYRARRIVAVSPIDGDMLSVALPGQLLQIGRKPLQVLL